MFALDRRTLNRLEPAMRRVLIVDPNAHAARLLMDIVKSLGAGDILIEGEEAKAFKHLESMDPGMVFLERSGPSLDGETFARRLRRSDLACRQVPIIMLTAEATARTILGARDAGVHEFLRKPFTAADLLKRVDNVCSKPRDWIEAIGYVGPDRRRFNSGAFTGPGKRKADKAAGEDPVAVAKDQAMRILASALEKFDTDPTQALRSIRDQAATLKQCAMKASDTTLVIAVSALDSSLANGAITRLELAKPIRGLLALHPIEELKKAG